MDNLTNRTRTRRAVMKKLRELNLVFKAPTKKSLASAVQKFQWNREQDEQLRQIYEENRHNKRPLKGIMAAVLANGAKRTRNAVIKRMIELGLIADKSDIVPQRNQRRPNIIQDNQSDDDGGSSDDDDGSDDGGNEYEEQDVDFDEMRNNMNRNLTKPAAAKNNINHGRGNKSGELTYEFFFHLIFI